MTQSTSSGDASLKSVKVQLHSPSKTSQPVRYVDELDQVDYGDGSDTEDDTPVPKGAAPAKPEIASCNIKDQGPTAPSAIGLTALKLNASVKTGEPIPSIKEYSHRYNVGNTELGPYDFVPGDIVRSLYLVANLNPKKLDKDPSIVEAPGVCYVDARLRPYVVIAINGFKGLKVGPMKSCGGKGTQNISRHAQASIVHVANPGSAEIVLPETGYDRTVWIRDEEGIFSNKQYEITHQFKARPGAHLAVDEPSHLNFEYPLTKLGRLDRHSIDYVLDFEDYSSKRLRRPLREQYEMAQIAMQDAEYRYRESQRARSRSPISIREDRDGQRRCPHAGGWRDSSPRRRWASPALQEPDRRSSRESYRGRAAQEDRIQPSASRYRSSQQSSLMPPPSSRSSLQGRSANKLLQRSAPQQGPSTGVNGETALSAQNKENIIPVALIETSSKAREKYRQDPDDNFFGVFTGPRRQRPHKRY